MGGAVEMAGNLHSDEEAGCNRECISLCVKIFMKGMKNALKKFSINFF